MGTIFSHILGSAIGAVVSFSALAQGNFQNLDFESPLLPLVHVGSGSFDFVAVSNAVPGWDVFLGTNQRNSVLYNNWFLGNATVGLLGPDWTNSNPIRLAGSYSMNLQAGLDSNFQPTSASIAQSRLVPPSAMSVQMSVREFINIGGGQFAVTLGGQNIPMFPLSFTPNYTIFGGDILPFAGLIRELRISAVPTPNYDHSSFTIDSITFSDQPIPEPSSLILIGLGALFLGRQWLKRSRS
ncbi:MAG: PEP-CTERM sorting domain-containing protein [Pedosphaera sp.]|nr:PEP-CTERM sorting domain-containing protein [Pedosphaera sp.]